jgi:hypothetical protein
MNALKIDTPHNSDSFYAGAEIEVYLSWSLAEDPEAVELRLAWNTSGKGDQDLKVVKTVRFDSPQAREQRTVPLTLPWGPYSFSGKLISLIWAFELVALPNKESTRREFTLSHTGEEVLLGTDGQP